MQKAEHGRKDSEPSSRFSPEGFCIEHLAFMPVRKKAGRQPFRMAISDFCAGKNLLDGKQELQVVIRKRVKLEANNMTDESDILFEVMTPLGFRVRVTQAYWKLIIDIKHPVMAGREQDVRRVLEDPDEIRKSKSDENVYLFYRSEREKRWLCAVSKQTGGDVF